MVAQGPGKLHASLGMWLCDMLVVIPSLTLGRCGMLQYLEMHSASTLAKL